MSRFVGCNYFMPEGNFIALNASIRKEEKVTAQQSKFYLKKLAKEEQISQPREEGIKIKAPVITRCTIPSP